MTALHAIYAPSAAHTWMRCTASAQAIGYSGKDESGDEADEGTAAHSEIDRILGALVEIRADEPVLEYVKNVLNYEHPALIGIALFCGFVAKLPPGRIFVEQKVTLTDLIWGRCDLAHWDEVSRVLTIIDYKNGFIDVQAKENEQLQIYGAASIYTHNLPAKWVRLVVVQPNSFIPGPRVKQWVVSAEELHAFATRAAAVPKLEPTFTAGSHCRYCPMFGQCPATRDILAHVATMLAYPAKRVPAEMIGRFMVCKRPIEDWFKALEKHGLQLAVNGTVPENMTLVKGTTKRAWIDAEKARDAIFAQFGVKGLDAPTPAQAEKLGFDVSTLSTKPPGPPVLAFESDNRERYARPDVNVMFAAALEGSRK